MAMYQQKTYKILQIPMAVLAIDAISHLLVTFKGNRWAVTAICLHTSYVFTVLMKEKSAENVMQTYLSGIVSHKGGSVAILSDNEAEFKNKAVNAACDQHGIKRLFSNLLLFACYYYNIFPSSNGMEIPFFLMFG